MKKTLGVVFVVVVGLGVLAGSAHAAGGPGPHASADCLLCAFCSLLASIH
jgi:hypothetical protein